MSKQLTLSAAFAAVSMALLALAAAHGQFAVPSSAVASGQAPLFEMTIGQ